MSVDRTSDLIQKLRQRYPNLPPLLFHRSIERARSNGDLFDILDGCPAKYPITWSESDYCWVTTDDLFLKRNFRK